VGRRSAWVAGGYAVFSALSPTLELLDGRTIANPIGVAGVGNVDENRLGDLLDVLGLLSLVAAVCSLALRFRRSHGVECQQLKWFTYAGARTALSS
jgi:hypothetical protein